VRRNAARFYNKAFKSIDSIVTPTTKVCRSICENCNCHVFHQYTLKITNGQRDALHKHLLDNSIPNAIYYPVPLHRQKAYADERYNEEDFEVTNELIKTVISLPMHTEFDEEQLTFITNTILDFLNK
jgi:UDP-2-acetamido-2-deoxy-ribo-hexuluronate aminotransferase